MTTLHEAYCAAVRADSDYFAELQRVYKSKAGDARYNPKLSTATPRLKTLHDIWRDCEDKRHELAMEANTMIPTEAEKRQAIGNYPTCDECNEQHS